MRNMSLTNRDMKRLTDRQKQIKAVVERILNERLIRFNLYVHPPKYDGVLIFEFLNTHFALSRVSLSDGSDYVNLKPDNEEEIVDWIRSRIDMKAVEFCT